MLDLKIEDFFQKYSIHDSSLESIYFKNDALCLTVSFYDPRVDCEVFSKFVFMDFSTNNNYYIDMLKEKIIAGAEVSILNFSFEINKNIYSSNIILEIFDYKSKTQDCIEISIDASSVTASTPSKNNT